jgi:D-alanyl-lipoteichoic acid acyltransferase DltB (MBOAT superfamily)
MSLSEVEFAFFFPLVWLTYWAVPRRAMAQNAVLLGASYVFYAAWNWRMLGVVLAGTMIDLLVVRSLSDPTAAEARRRHLLAVSLTASLATLAFFKYEGFFASSANDLLQALGLHVSVPLLSIALPIGISFFTLQRVGYVLDVYWRRVEPPRSGLAFAVFCCYFPQLTAGPIARGSELLAQLERERTLTAGMLADGAAAFLCGFALKAWAADAIGAVWVDPVFAQPAIWNAAAEGLAVVGFMLQVFGDFAGYSLMAIGVSRMLALELPVNFDAPLISQSLPELWRRWHITLNRWLFDYVFTPLTTSHGWLRGRISIGLLVTFLLSGLWHGAAWTFVLWGALHGVGMVVHERWDAFYRRLCRTNRSYVALRTSAGYAVAGWALTIGFFLLTLIPFRAARMSDAVVIASRLFGLADGRAVQLGGLEGLSAVLGVAFIVAYHLVALPSLARARARFQQAPPLVRGIAYGVAVIFLLVFAPVGTGSFIYQQF